MLASMDSRCETSHSYETSGTEKKDSNFKIQMET